MGPRVSPLDNEQCKQCTSFADYVKQTRKKQKADQKDDVQVEQNLIHIIHNFFLLEYRRLACS